MIQVFIGYTLDVLFGDPYWIKHPVIYIGSIINRLEDRLMGLKSKKIGGVLLLLIIMTISYMVPFTMLLLAKGIHPYLGIALEALMICQILATKSLHRETKKVYDALMNKDMKASRLFISYLVSRDTGEMAEEDIVRSSIETVAENIVDGIIAPLFFVIIGGAPLGWLYKGVNTLDSMVGYKNDKFMDYGWASARFDDLLNYIPSRVTGPIIVLAAFLLGYDYKNSFRVLKRDCRNHSSPNSGFSEAPVAGALNIQLGGRVSYFGVIHNKPTMGDQNETLAVGHIDKTFKVMFLSSFLSLLIFSAIKYII